MAYELTALTPRFVLAAGFTAGLINIFAGGGTLAFILRERPACGYCS
ncbi:MAG: hypothetical protein ACOY9J_05170 [Pseudomonadota bacterium]